MRVVHYLLIIGFVQQLSTACGNHLAGQDIDKNQIKKNPAINPVKINPEKKDSVKTAAKTSPRPLPKFDLPEYIITGIATNDLPRQEKLSLSDTSDIEDITSKFSNPTRRGQKAIELGSKDPANIPSSRTPGYSGLIQAGIGTYFTPRFGLWFGQTLSDFHYTLEGKYHLTKGFAGNTDQSGGSFSVSGGTIINPNMQLLQEAALEGEIGYGSESYYFYGSTNPNIQRTASDIALQLNLSNQKREEFPYSAGILIGNLSVSDSSASTNETRFDLHAGTLFDVGVVPIQTEFRWISATGGIQLMDLSGGIKNYQYGGMIFDGMLHFFWAKGMSGQNEFRIRPNLTMSYRFSDKHLAYVAYRPMFLPVTLYSSIRANRFLSATSVLRQTDITDAGEIGIESDWSRWIRTQVSFSVQSVREFPLFTDSLRRGIWMTTYGGRTTVVTLYGEVVAKLESNDYFASNIILRSVDDSYLNKAIPYMPVMECSFSIRHHFGKKISATFLLRFVGERNVDFEGGWPLSKYTIIDLDGEYIPFGFMKLMIGIKNLTDERYEVWRGYREFPMTLHAALQFKW